MSNTINVKVKSLDAKSLLTNPNMAVLDTKDKLILNNIKIGMDTDLSSQIKLNLASTVSVLEVTGQPVTSSIGELPVGSSVYINVDGVRTEFLVVQQGNPGYDSSCDGTWLLMNNLLGVTTVFDALSVSSGTPGQYLHNTFLPSIEDNVQSMIKTVNIPFNQNLFDKYETVKIFVLSTTEVGLSTTDVGLGTLIGIGDNGKVLEYFRDGDSQKRIAYNISGNPDTWWLRTFSGRTSPGAPVEDCYAINSSGDPVLIRKDSYLGIRPAFVLPSDTTIDENFNIVTETISGTKLLTKSGQELRDNTNKILIY
jgi:hypothetical protein